jgi:hypothetical protein
MPIFFVRGLVDILYAFNLLSTYLESPYRDVFLLFFTETIPCLAISHIMKKRKQPTTEPENERAESDFYRLG